MFRVAVWFAVGVAAAATPLAMAQTAVPTAGVATAAGANAWSGNIRASDDELVALVAEGVKKSPTLRTLADRLTRSDVIVYVRPDVTAKSNSQGSLTFLSATGGFRYLVIKIPSTQSRQQKMAILGHELQHAVSIADAPSVIDSETLKKEFEKIGSVGQTAGNRGFSFDSPAAVETRRRVLSEVQ